jgi:peptidoglycan/xylan/chitin deacetylase (PgdA/CDA1 family)
MDHELYPYSPISTRPRLAWPGNKPLAAAIFLYLEHWELFPPEGTYRDPRFRDPFGDYQPDYRTYTWREYGNRVGIFRLFDLLDGLDLPVTVAANASAMSRYGYLVEQCLKRGYAFAAHGTHATRMVTSRMSLMEETDLVNGARETIRRHTGTAPAGWVSQDYSETAHTPRILADAGFTYLSDWPNDDQPYLMKVGRGIVSLPNQSEWDDVQLMWHRRLLPPRYPAIVMEAADVLMAEATRAASGRYMALHLHPWLSGMPHRFVHVARAVTAFARIEGAWFATAADIADIAAGQLRSVEP